MFNVAIIVIGVLIFLYLGLTGVHMILYHLDKWVNHWKICKTIDTIRTFVAGLAVIDLGVLALSFILEIGGIG